MLVILVLIGICMVGDAYTECALYEIKAKTMTHLYNMNLEAVSSKSRIDSMLMIHFSKMRTIADSAIYEARSLVNCFKFRMLSIAR